MRGSLRLVLVAWLVLAALPAFAQYAEIPRPLPAGAVTIFGSTFAEQIRSATQIGRRLFIGGRFTQLGNATGGAAVVNPLGVVQRRRFQSLAATCRRSWPTAAAAGSWPAVSPASPAVPSAALPA